MAELTMAGITAGSVVACAYPVLLLIFGVIMVRASRRGELASLVFQASGWLLGIGLVSLALYIFAGMYRLPSLGWVAVGLLVLSAVFCSLLLRNPLTRLQKSISWILLFNTLFVVAFGSFALWLANRAMNISAYNNSNEAEVRAALAKNPNNAAAHSSLALIDRERGDHVGEVAEYRRVLRVEPDNTDALILLGGRLTQARRIEEARPIFQKLAARNDAYSDNARRWLARHGQSGTLNLTP